MKNGDIFIKRIQLATVQTEIAKRKCRSIIRKIWDKVWSRIKALTGDKSVDNDNVVDNAAKAQSGPVGLRVWYVHRLPRTVSRWDIPVSTCHP